MDTVLVHVGIKIASSEIKTLTNMASKTAT